jgi:hypothetical protein
VAGQWGRGRDWRKGDEEVEVNLRRKGHGRHVATCGKAGVDVAEDEGEEEGGRGNGVMVEKEASGRESESNV